MLKQTIELDALLLRMICPICTKEFFPKSKKAVCCSKLCNDRLYYANRKKADPVKYYAAARNRTLVWKYGITQEQYNQKLVEQNGVCAICRQPPKEGKLLSVDHNHSTGMVRKLLCQPCNIYLGYIKENEIVALNLASYITEDREKEK